MSFSDENILICQGTYYFLSNRLNVYVFKNNYVYSFNNFNNNNKYFCENNRIVIELKFIDRLRWLINLNSYIEGLKLAMVSYFINIIRALVKVNIMAQLIYQVVNIYFKITRT